MWARILEFSLAMWMAMSPFIFRCCTHSKFLWINVYTCSFLIILFAFLSYSKKFEKAHLFNLVIAAWLVLLGFICTSKYPAPPFAQNKIIVGILLSLLALVPSHANHPPIKWTQFYRKKEK